jgi:hypothetical protein
MEVLNETLCHAYQQPLSNGAAIAAKREKHWWTWLAIAR